MRPICWIHISDIHARLSDAWSQDVVLTAMCDYIAQQRANRTAADFILATGDLAFSGKAEEYALAGEFFDNRDRQNLCFRGARASLQDQNRIDAMLEAGEDLETLLKRQENYRGFQNSYFKKQDRTQTDDGLGYVSHFTIEDVRLAIIGLDSA
jgi:hypothetical protein